MADRPLDLLLVEDDEAFRTTAAQWMSRNGHRVEQAANGQEALLQFERKRFDVAVVDMNMPGITGLELLQRLREKEIETEILILTGQATVENAVAAMKLGASDYLTKPFALAELERRARMAADRGHLVKENRQLRELVQRQQTKTEIIGKSEPMLDVFHLIDRVAPTDKSVLIHGESGTGKELVAKSIQEKSPRARQPFVTINCAALPESLVESELFGHEKGAFTGATNRKSGLFEVADTGTLFIDELGELPLSLQPKLLRVLEDGSLRHVGSHQERRVDVRVIAATNRDLQKEVREGRFREDLYYRINVITIDLPPLRSRGTDVNLLIDHMLGGSWEVEPEAREAMHRYHWPGNVRQLINAMDRAMILADDNVITLDDLPREVIHAELTQPASPAEAAESQTDLSAIERAHIVAILKKEKGNKARAARTLGIHRRKLYRLIERFGIETETA
ncbi:sigma-54-dependent transcriptional regulator [Planctomicrobium piriforme]|uniref:Two-component system, NtrC family, response regulator/two-component system, NtrC family, response regulator AtoC n=1 Tax=Planctomicrobium piriforme TaxID=1576369 RepID=A0A1I3B4E5_9PLAN|nr:sigma-54 dependent transcriptional regulator [Planctomicrobium piriforme]SFH56829.1 two-component system, NtrC family, response regulator/two-component system, NtrC family, response regulator AtoC [Planctomicrobium piriforme]